MFNGILLVVFIAAVMVIPKTETFDPAKMDPATKKAFEKLVEQALNKNCKQRGHVCHTFLPCCQGLSCQLLLHYRYCF